MSKIVCVIFVFCACDCVCLGSKETTENVFVISKNVNEIKKPVENSSNFAYCNKETQERHCFIEHSVKDIWPHIVRWRYTAVARGCVKIYYSRYCGHPTEANNFATKSECSNACGGVQKCLEKNYYKDCVVPERIKNLWPHKIRVFKRFRAVNPELVPKRMTEAQAHTIAVPVDQMETLPELKENPFKRRICQVFSHDGSGDLTFEDFLDMMSVFSEAAPRDIKAWYAFRIYDLDDDMYIGREDLLEATRLLTKGELHALERDEIVCSVLDEADVDGDGRLSFMDFEHVVVRAPDFLSTFHIRV